MSWALLIRLGCLHPDVSVDGWWKCLRCLRFFTKRVDELYCFDCIDEQCRWSG